LGLAVQLCTLPWLGFVPDDVASAPPAAVALELELTSHGLSGRCSAGRNLLGSDPCRMRGMVLRPR
ncbi:MAG: DUF4158 domain-containing protein, partial [Actinomycetota bacterium]|nr:DUF4158 domain-containing protein [Actinomycetota bacterium]